MSSIQPIFLFGAGGHARALAEVMRREGRYRVERVLDDDPGATSPAGLPPVDGGREQLAELAQSGLRHGFIAVGNNADRELIDALAQAAGLDLISVVDPSAVVASDARIGLGSAVMPHAFIGAAASIGRCVIVNTSATVDHDCSVDDYAHIAVGVNLAGECHVGARSFVGAGAVLAGGVRVGDRAIIGAGAAVLTDVDAGVVAVGVPAREVSSSP